VSRPIELRIPNERPYHGVVRLVVGGLAARHNLSYEKLEDLQLALVTVLESDDYTTGPEVVVELEVSADAIALCVGPLHGDALQEELGSKDGDALGLGRLLGTLVEDAQVERREDGDWLRLAKLVRGARAAGANA
jgi:hypothetical protein